MIAVGKTKEITRNAVGSEQLGNEVDRRSCLHDELYLSRLRRSLVQRLDQHWQQL